MSFNRENVTWQAPDGTWSLGFFEVTWTGEDPEWDVEYGSKFCWVTTGHATEDAAYAAWDGANPGGGDVMVGPQPAFDAEVERIKALRNQSSRNVWVDPTRGNW